LAFSLPCNTLDLCNVQGKETQLSKPQNNHDFVWYVVPYIGFLVHINILKVHAYTPDPHFQQKMQIFFHFIFCTSVKKLDTFQKGPSLHDFNKARDKGFLHVTYMKNICP
jgi:hypothetical protein